MAQRLNITALGMLEISASSEQLETSGETTAVGNSLAIKEKALFCYLLITGKVYTRDQLCSLFWGEDSEKKAKNSLRVALTNIRKKVHKDCIAAPDRQRVSFNMEVLGNFDVYLFDQIVESLSDEESEATMADIERAMGLYRGELLADLLVREAATFQEWLGIERVQRRQKVMNLFARQIEFYLVSRRYHEALVSLQRQLQLEPWNEIAHQQMMTTLSHMGDFNGALQQYETCRQCLQDELSVEPMPKTEQLLERIIAARNGRRDNLPTQMMPFVGRPDEINTLHRLLADPQNRLVTVMGLGGIGKTSLALHVAQQLYNEQAITFLNGIFFIALGPIRTLEQLLSTIADTLEIPLRQSKDSLAQILDTLYNKELLLVLDDWDSLLDSLKRFGGGSEAESTEIIHTLLDRCPNLSILITSRDPLRLRFEKRVELEGLTIPPDNAYSISGYSAADFFLQTANQVHPGFTDTDENRPYIIQICKQLDGMPLGIELAAAWVRVMSCKQIASELHDLDFLSADMQDLPDRQRSLRAVFDYSWQLMSEQEHDVFMRLSVFSDLFTQETAALISDLTPQILRSLLDHSLVKRANSDAAMGSMENDASINYFDLVPTHLNTDRLQPIIEVPQCYSLHNIVRQYATEKLAENKNLQYDTRQKHSTYYANFMQKQRERFYTDDHHLALALIRQEKQNVISAWGWALNYVQLDNLDKILDAIEEYYLLAGTFKEAELSARLSVEYLSAKLAKAVEPEPQARIMLGRIWAYQARFLAEIDEYDSMLVVSQKLLSLAEETENVEIRATALYLSGFANQQLGRIEQSTNELNESLQLAEGASLSMIIALNLRKLGTMTLWQADYEKAQELFTNELGIWRTLNDRRGEMVALNNLGVLVHQNGDYANAHLYYSDARNLFAQMGDPGRYSHMLNNLGRIYSEQRNFSKAMRYTQRAIQIKRSLGDKTGESNALLSLGRNYMLIGQYAIAQELHNEALKIKRSIGDWHGEAESLTYLTLIHCLRGDHQYALEYTVLANTILERNVAQFIHAKLLTIHSHILFNLEYFAEAKEAAAAALAEWQARKNINLSMEPLANLARIEFEMGNRDTAIEYVKEILDHLKTGNLDGVNFPLHIYLICYDILNQVEDPRRGALITQANDKLAIWSNAIEDDELRHSYLSIKHHLRIQELSASI